jgi:hypothetical protein
VHGRPAVLVRVVPEAGGLLFDRPLGRPGGTGVDLLVRAAVHAGRQAHAVPVQRGGLGQVVADVHGDLVARADPDGRAEEVAVHAPRLGALARQQLALSGAQVEVEVLAAVGVHPRFEHRRHGHRVVEREPAGVRVVGVVVGHRERDDRRQDQRHRDHQDK